MLNDVSTIEVGKRARALDADRVALLRDSIQQLGLLQPIVVTADGRLVAGLHRLEAVKQLGWTTVPVQVIEADELAAELAEIDENLIRHELTVLEQADHLLRRDEILTAMGMRAARGDNRYTDRGETVSPLKTSADIANEIGLGERAAQGRIQIARSIAPDVKDKIADTELANRTRDLLALARLEPEQQRRVVEFDGVVDGELRVADVARRIENPLPHVMHNSGDNEWYTPPEYIEAARRVMGGIDLDPASSDKANETVGASKYYTTDDDGLRHSWRGRVWMNPPYSQPLIGLFCSGLRSELESGAVTQAITLTNNATETAWFADLLANAAAVCFIRGRVRFLDRDGNATGAPLQGQAVVYSGPNIDGFAREFGKFGAVLYV